MAGQHAENKGFSARWDICITEAQEASHPGRERSEEPDVVDGCCGAAFERYETGMANMNSQWLLLTTFTNLQKPKPSKIPAWMVTQPCLKRHW